MKYIKKKDYMPDFGVDAHLIPEDQIQLQIDNIFVCLKDSGINMESKIDDPGIAALINTLIRSIEKAFIAAYEPLIALVNIVTESLEAGIKAITTFLEKVKKLISGITELLANLPMSIVDFIVEKLLDPIIKNINIPFPNAEALIEILTFKVNINDIDWEKWLKEGKLIIPQNLLDKGENAINKVMTLYKKAEGFTHAAFLKVMEFLMFPINFAIEILTSVLEFVGKLVTNLFDAIGEIMNIISNPVQWVMDFISDIFAKIMLKLAKYFLSIDIPDTAQFEEKFNEFISKIFKIGATKINIKEWIKTLPEKLQPAFEAISGFIALMQCFIKWFVSLLTPSTILGVFGINLNKLSLPPIKVKAYNSSGNLVIIEPENITAEDIPKFLKVDDKILLTNSSSETKEGKIKQIFGLSLILYEDPFNQSFTNGSFKKS